MVPQPNEAYACTTYTTPELPRGPITDRALMVGNTYATVGLYRRRPLYVRSDRNRQGKASNGGINREVLKCSPGCPEIALAYIYPRIGQPLCSTSHPGDLHAVYPIAQELLYAQN
jgi:hypothetical protein